MKKAFALMLSVFFVLALLAGCAGSGNVQTNNSGTAAQETTTQPENTAGSGGASEPEPTENSPYHLAAGKYETDANGIPLALYEYESPLTTGEDVLTFWTTTFSPQYIPEEGFDYMPNVIGERERTGVNMEYIIVGSEMRFENLAVLLASDDLPDVLSQALIFIGMSPNQAVSEGFLVNLYDYREYMPNYMYYANNLDANTKATIESEAGTIYAFYALFDKCYTTMGYMVREDWLNKFDLTHDDIVTIDDVHEMLTLFKTQIDGCQWPMEIISSVDVVNFFSCFDTQTQVDSTALPTGYIVDGQVVLPHSGPNDLKFVDTLSQWFSEGLIDPNWPSYLYTAYFAGNVAGGVTGFTFMQPSEVDGFEGMSPDPDTQWAPVKSTLLTKDQTLHFAYGATNLGYGHSCIASRCSNIPLAISWCDWRYSPTGSFFSSYGEEGVTWEYGENGVPTMTDYAVRNPDGITYASLSMFYMVNFLAEHGMEIYDRKYAFNGGERFLAMHGYWDEIANDNAYKWPSGIHFTDDQNAELARYGGDLVTFISENFLAFLDGSKALDEWDTYVAALYDMGWEEVRQIKQEAYDAFIAQNIS
ncbi:MAG: hypothetical protein GX111_02825 [Clostridiales bacterium]|nr:hypothetical protein [Clostridiales bacterium]